MTEAGGKIPGERLAEFTAHLGLMDEKGLGVGVRGDLVVSILLIAGFAARKQTAIRASRRFTLRPELSIIVTSSLQAK